MSSYDVEAMILQAQITAANNRVREWQTKFYEMQESRNAWRERAESMARYVMEQTEAPAPPPVGKPRRNPITPLTRYMVYARDEWACKHCGATDALQIDHIHPIARGGSDDMDNLQTLCSPCNSRKGARVPGGDIAPDTGYILNDPQIDALYRAHLEAGTVKPWRTAMNILDTAGKGRE